MRRRPRIRPDDLKVRGRPGDVSPWDVRFDPADLACREPLGDGRHRVRVWTEPGLQRAAVVTRHGGTVTEWPLEAVETIRFLIWEGVVGPFDGESGWSLAFDGPSGPVYVTAHGVASAVERLDRWSIPAGEPAVSVPDWAKGAVMYQIFPERFANGDPANDPNGTVPWGTPPAVHQFQGGDLVGVTQRLDHLSWLGVDVIYLNPVFASPSNHKYDTVDYLSVDEAFGGDEALGALVAAAHRRGMRVILDASFNHVHPRFFAFADVVERGSESRYADWFVVHSWPLTIGVRGEPGARRGAESAWARALTEETGIDVVQLDGEGYEVEPSYDAWYRVPTMPRLDLSNPEPRAYALEVARHWIREFDVDGWRMDVTRYVDADFWSDFRAAVRTVRSDTLLISEVMGDASAWLQGDAFDGTMNYTFRSLALRFLASGDIDGPTFLDDAARAVYGYAWPMTLASQQLVSSHDTPRFLTEAGGERWRLKLAAVLQLTMPGIAGLYYGDEMHLAGGDDPGCRGAFPWHEDPSEHETAVAIAELTALRRRRRELVDGVWRPAGASGDLVAFERIGARRSLVAVNRGPRRSTLDLPRRYRRVLWGEGSTDGRRIEVAPRAALVVADR